jgi:hypothetical protein
MDFQQVNNNLLTIISQARSSSRATHALDILPQGLEWKIIPIKMIANHEMGWETGSGEIRLVPTSLDVLGLYQILHTGPDFRGLDFARSDKAH